MLENRHLRYLVDPFYTEDYGVEPPRSRLLLAGAAVAGGLLLLRTSLGHRALSSLSSRLAPRAMGPSALEEGLLGLHYSMRELADMFRSSSVTGRRLLKELEKEGVDQSREVFRRHAIRLEEAFISRMMQYRDRGSILGLRPVTVEDVLSRRVPFEFQSFRYLKGRTGEQPFHLEDAPPAIMEAWLKRLVRRHPQAMAMPVDPNLFISPTGEVVDLRGFGQLYSRMIESLQHFNLPIVGWNPFEILRMDLRQAIHRQSLLSFIPQGSLQPFLSPDPVQRNMLLIGDKLVDFADPRKVLGSGFYIAPFGAPLRAAANLAEVAHKDIQKALQARGWLARLADVGGQTDPSFFGQIASIVKRRQDPSDPRAFLQRLLTGERDSKTAIRRARRALHQLMSETSVPLDERTMKSLGAMIERTYGDLFPGGRVALSTESDLVDTLYRLVSQRHQLSRTYGRSLLREWKELTSSPSTYFQKVRFSRRRLPPVPYGALQEVQRTSKADHLRYLIQREIIQKVAEKAGKHPLEMFADHAQRSSALRRMLVESTLGAHPLKSFMELVRGDQALSRQFREMLASTVKQVSPWYAPGTFPPSPSKMMAQQAKGGLLMRSWIKPPSISEIVDAFHIPEARTRLADKMSRFVRQFFAGRHDREHFTTATLIPYHMMSRLNDMFSFFGLGLSQRHLGSAQQIFTQLLLRRYIGVQAAIGYAGYLSWEIANLTGLDPRQAAFDTLAGANIAWASLMNVTGITGLVRRMEQVMPGSEMIWELPVLSFFDPRWQADELAEFLREGTAPVRSGRFWQFGSTPIQGGPILYFWPSWYRRFTTDWEFTDVLWGEREEAYRNWWLPTPRYPMAPIRRFLTEPYHLEERWGRHRPYPLTGPIPELENLPVIGPLLSATIGRALKPTQRMYEDEIAAWQAGVLHEGAVLPMRAERAPVTAYITPAGMIQLQRFVPSSVLGLSSQDVSAGHAIPDVAVGGGTGFSMAAIQLQAIHEGKQAVAAGRPPGIPVRVRPSELTPSGAPIPREALPGDAVRLQAMQAMSEALDIMGLYGFLARVATGTSDRPWEQIPRLETAWRPTSLGRWHRELQIGGFPGELSEVGRRFLPGYRYPDPEVDINPIRNVMPSWMPGADYFINFQIGDPYARIPGGEYRLPGPAHERMWDLPSTEERLKQLFPDEQVRGVVRQLIEAELISPYEMYTAWERFRILADVAPYSQEYEYYKNLLTQNKQLIPPSKHAQFQKIKKQVSEYKQRDRLFPYRFRYADLQHETVTVKRVLDNGYFLTEEYPDRPFRFAGIYIPHGQDEAGQRAREFLSRFLYPGARVTVGFAADEARRYGSDQFGAILATVYAGGMNLGREMLLSGIAREREQWDPASVHTRFGPMERFIGSAWEAFAHLDTPLHTKFLQVRSPLEMYKRRDLFGKQWQPWSEPISSILLPTLESLVSHHPLVSALYGYGYGRLITLVSPSRSFQHKAGIVGALALGALSTLRTLWDAVSGERWIPPRRRLEREIDLYFQALEYMKFKGLYEFARRRALEEEGFDVESLYRSARLSGRELKRTRTALEDIKRQLLLSGQEIALDQLQSLHEQLQRLGATPAEPEHERLLRRLNEGKIARGSTEQEAVYKALLRSINARLQELGEQRRFEELTPWAEIAMMARQRYESTAFGVDLWGHLSPVFASLPRNERRYLTDFINAPAAERQEILELVSLPMRRALQARWGMEPDPLPSLEELFRRYWLPSPSSEVWSPAKNLDDLKIRVVEQMGLELTEFGFWPADVARAERHQAPILPWNQPQRGVDLERQLRAILQGQGLEEVWVQIRPSGRRGVQLSMDIRRDPTLEMVDFIRAHPRALLGEP